MYTFSLVGQTAFSSFIINKFIEKAKKNNLIIPNKITTNYIYFIKTKFKIEPNNIFKLYSILNTDIVFKISYVNRFFIIIPRFGTISSWSSKAIDILKKCGLNSIIRIERGILFQFSDDLDNDDLTLWSNLIVDKMTQSVIICKLNIDTIFNTPVTNTFNVIDIASNGIDNLNIANKQHGWALSAAEIHYLYNFYNKLNKNPTDVELMMFAQVNSEHCRHKIFNANFIIDDHEKQKTLFQMIKETHFMSPYGTILAYTDNCAILSGIDINRFYPNVMDNKYSYHKELTNIIIKVETHNHPTAISPFEGAATGAGGEIRDEAATGKGSKPKASFTGFVLSNLNIPNSVQSWEKYYNKGFYGKPNTLASALEIIIKGPIGAASFNNEFGRPNVLGFFRTFELKFNTQIRGYHKPIMISGGIGNIQDTQNFKNMITADALIIVLGGPGFLIGLAGGSASSMQSGINDLELDFNSVQRSNPEMQRRCQEVIDKCWQLKENNPIIAIHDVGAGGLANAISELIHDSNKGGILNLRKIPVEDFSMSPLQIWCNESQERYVLSILPSDLNLFSDICKRENCPFAVLGIATEDKNLKLIDSLFNNNPVDLPLNMLFDHTPKMLRKDTYIKVKSLGLDQKKLNFKESLYKVLQLPTVASKSFLITIADRSIGGLVARDQMIGNMQVPVSDCAVTLMDFTSFVGEAMSIGEKGPLALLDEVSSVRMAVSEAITNISGVNIGNLNNLKLSANWMAACEYLGEDSRLYNAVEAVSKLCQDLKISIPVGKDSLSMATIWKQDNQTKSVISPLTLIVSAFCKVKDVRKTITAELKIVQDTSIILFDLGWAKNRMGGSCFAQVYQSLADIAPNLDNYQDLINLFNFIQDLIQSEKILAYHDRSDGGLIITILEMMFAGNTGVDLHLDRLCINDDKLSEILFNEELGCVIQINNNNLQQIVKLAQEYSLFNCMYIIGKLNRNLSINIFKNNNLLFSDNLLKLKKLWSTTSYNIARLRDNPICVDSEFDLISNLNQPLLFSKLSFNLDEITIPYINIGAKPKVAILREQGVNGHIEMAFAFYTAGFDCIDVHMNDLLNDQVDINNFNVVAVCGGFSYGDVFGAGIGWSKTILYNNKLRDAFEKFFYSKDKLSLGVCNGCQMLSNLREIIPGTDNWPYFKKNISEQFEARLIMVKINKSPSLFLQGMQESSIPIVINHAQGRASFVNENSKNLFNKNLISLQYVDQDNFITLKYPLNPNGSDFAIAGVTNLDGRITIMMPHPERVVRKVQFSWSPSDWKSDLSPWMKIFINVRKEFD